MEPKMLAAVAAIALLSAMLGGYMVQQKAVSTINEAIATQISGQAQATCAPAKETATAAATQQQAAASTATTAPATTSKKGVSGTVILDEQPSFKELPWTKDVTLEQGRYEVYFEADQKIKFMVYSDASGSQKIKVTTQFGAKCCESSGFYTVDINTGEGGKYKIVFDDSEMTLADARPTKGLVQIGKTADI
jgi:phage/plasmid primase-like uncharacterized protein